MLDSYVNNDLTCSASQLAAIGEEIHQIYDEAVNQKEKFIVMDTTVCPKGITKGPRHLKTRETQDNDRDLRKSYIKYIWSGHGLCYFCPPDNADRRMMLLAEDERDDSSTDGRQLNGHDFAWTLEDFSKDSAGNQLTVRNYVKYEWRNKYGMTVTVKNTSGFTPKGRARIFNTANVTGGAHGLGAPNENCDLKRNPRFPGKGNGGKPGMPGANCFAQGNVLIIQETEQWDPSMWKQSGEFVFSFHSPTRIGTIGLMDVSDRADAQGLITYMDVYGQSFKISFKGLGGNSIQTVAVDKIVKKVTVQLKLGGAVRFIKIWTPKTAEDALSKQSKLFLANRSFVQYIPFLEFDLSYFLTRQINDKFGRNPASCLFDKWADITVKLKQVSTLASLQC